MLENGKGQTFDDSCIMITTHLNDVLFLCHFFVRN